MNLHKNSPTGEFGEYSPIGESGEYSPAQVENSWGIAGEDSPNSPNSPNSSNSPNSYITD
jgi:hypothetical protein